MLKQLPSRNQRSKGSLKTKHFLQACLLLAICIWLLSQIKHSYEKNAHKEGLVGVMNKVVKDNLGSVKLGRKDLHHEADRTSSEVGIEDEVESMSEDNEEDSGGGGDDEIDGRYQEKAEEEENELGVEDLIDLQDKDNEDELEDDEIKGVHKQDKMVIQERGNVPGAKEEFNNGDDVVGLKQ